MHEPTMKTSKATRLGSLGKMGLLWTYPLFQTMRNFYFTYMAKVKGGHIGSDK